MGNIADYTIVGAGLIGPALALCLAQQGLRVDLIEAGGVEAGEAPESLRAINITLCARGMAVLSGIGLEDEIRQRSVPLYGRWVHRSDGASGFEPYGPAREALLSVRRQELRRILLRAVLSAPNVQVRPHSRCVGLDLERRTLAVALAGAASSSTVPFQRLIGADGTNSAVRRFVADLGLIESSVQQIDMIYREYVLERDSVEHLGLDRGALHFWSQDAATLIGFPNYDGSVTLSLHKPSVGGAASEESDGVRVLSGFSQVAAHFKRKSGLGGRQPPLGRMSTVRCSTWHVEDKVLLIGDAGHGIIPYLGQGANAGLEDCAVLSRLLAGAGSAFQAFEARRKPDLDFLANLCFGHMNFLRKDLGSEQQRLRSRVEQILSQQTTERSLYYNISFSHLSYREAYAGSRLFESGHSSVVEELQGPGGADDARLKEVVARVLQRAGANQGSLDGSALSA